MLRRVKSAAPESASDALHLGTAAWAIPAAIAGAFPRDGSRLSRYAARLNATEINSTHYRRHLPSTFQRWAETTPPDFRFAVKAPRQITHEARLAGCDALLDAFLGDVLHLGEKLGVVLVQTPPSLEFDGVGCRFLDTFRRRFDGQVALEPRHPTWFEPAADATLRELEVARVAADPSSCHAAAADPGGWQGLAYWRWHGSPRVYFSAYETETLRRLAERLRTGAAPDTWVIFDNTAHGAAAPNALALQQMLGAGLRSAVTG